MSRPGFEPGPPAWEASTLEKSHLDSLSAGHSEPLLSRHLLTTFGPLQYIIYSICPSQLGAQILKTLYRTLPTWAGLNAIAEFEDQRLHWPAFDRSQFHLDQDSVGCDAGLTAVPELWGHEAAHCSLQIRRTKKRTQIFICKENGYF